MTKYKVQLFDRQVKINNKTNQITLILQSGTQLLCLKCLTIV